MRKPFIEVILLTTLAGCQGLDDTPLSVDETVTVSLAFSAMQPSEESLAATRLADAVVQSDGSAYRGVDIMQLIPFRTQGKITATDKPLRLLDEAVEHVFNDKSSPYGAFYEYNAYTLMTGTASFLVYAKAKDYSADKTVNEAVNGSLVPEFPVTLEPSGISFSPDRICPSVAVPAEAQALADALTQIANAQADGKKWSLSRDIGLETLFQNFIGQTSYSGEWMLMAGASANVRKHVDALKTAVSALTYSADTDEAAVQSAVLKAIDGVTISDNYPASLGLPDGAAALLWNGEAFVPQVQTTTKASVNTISRYCYPPALYYFANSRINTSETAEKTSTFETKTSWGEVLQQYEHASGMVRSDTKAAAIVEPLQYAVARLQVSIKAGSAELKDRRGNTISLSDKHDAFPLTGMIVCNQHQQGFDFKPVGSGDDCFAYDCQMKKTDGTDCYLSTNLQTVPSTLALQSRDEEPVTVILEFRNDSGQDFYGKEGLIYQGTKFYLIGILDPKEGHADGVSDDVKKRVFTQDHTTVVTMTVDEQKSLPNAYNVLPDILGGRLEVGIELTPQWIQATPSTVILE